MIVNDLAAFLRSRAGCFRESSAFGVSTTLGTYPLVVKGALRGLPGYKYMPVVVIPG